MPVLRARTEPFGDRVEHDVCEGSQEIVSVLDTPAARTASSGTSRPAIVADVELVRVLPVQIAHPERQRPIGRRHEDVDMSAHLAEPGTGPVRSGSARVGGERIQAIRSMPSMKYSDPPGRIDPHVVVAQGPMSRGRRGMARASTDAPLSARLSIRPCLWQTRPEPGSGRATCRTCLRRPASRARCPRPRAARRTSRPSSRRRATRP